jgi:hypothetical protein
VWRKDIHSKLSYATGTYVDLLALEELVEAVVIGVVLGDTVVT